MDIKEVRKQMLDEINKCEELKQIFAEKNISEEIVKRNVGRLHDYMYSLRDQKDCIKVGKCQHIGSTHNFKLSVDGDYLIFEPMTCPIYLKEQKVSMSYVYKDFPKEQIDLRIKDIKKDLDYTALMSGLIKYYLNKTGLLYIKDKNQKQSLEYVLSFVNQALEEADDSNGAVIDFRNRIRKYASNYFELKEDLNNEFINLMQVDHLIIYNFGNEEQNKLIREAFTLPLLDERISSNKKTIIISELSLNELHSLLDYSRKDIRIKQLINKLTSNVEEEIIINK